MSAVHVSVPCQQSLFKRIFQGSSLYALAFLGQRVISLLLLPITTRFLSPADYATSDLTEQISGLLSILLGLYFSSVMGYFYVRCENADQRREVVWTTVVGSGLIGLLASAVCFPFAAPISRLVFGSEVGAPYLRVTLLVFAVSFSLEALLCWTRVTDRQGTYVLGALFRIGITAVGIITLVGVFRLRVWGVLATSVAAMGLTVAFLGAAFVRAGRPAFRFDLFVKMSRFAAPIALTGVASFAINTGDRLLLPHYGSLAGVGVYALAYKFGMLVSMAYSSFQSYWEAQSFQILRRPDAGHVFARLFTYVLLGICGCGLLIINAASPILTLMAAPAFHGAATLAPVIVAAYSFRAVGDFLRVLFVVEGRPALEAVSTAIGAALCIGGYVVLIPRYGTWGAATATLAAFIALTGITAAWTYRLRAYAIEGVRVAKIAAATAAALILHFLLTGAPLGRQVIAAVLSLGLFALLLWLLRFPTKGEMQAVRAQSSALVRRLSRAPVSV